LIRHYSRYLFFRGWYLTINHNFSAFYPLFVPYYKEREEDPMLAYMRKKKEKVSGPVRKMPVYQGPQPPPNRFVKLVLSV
jgi:hypothetical protein